MRRGIAIVVAVAALLMAPGTAAGDPPELLPLPTGHVRLLSGVGELRAPNGNLYLLPQGTHILDDVTWEKVDLELARLQEREVRLDAENKSLRESAKGWQPGWKTLLGALASGLAAGWYVSDKL